MEVDLVDAAKLKGILRVLGLRLRGLLLLLCPCVVLCWWCGLRGDLVGGVMWRLLRPCSCWVLPRGRWWL